MERTPHGKNPLVIMAWRALERGDSAHKTLQKKYPQALSRITLPSTHGAMVDAIEEAIATGDGVKVSELCEEYVTRMQNFCKNWDNILQTESRKQRWTQRR